MLKYLSKVIFFIYFFEIYGFIWITFDEAVVKFWMIEYKNNHFINF